MTAIGGEGFQNALAILISEHTESFLDLKSVQVLSACPDSLFLERNGLHPSIGNTILKRVLTIL